MVARSCCLRLAYRRCSACLPSHRPPGSGVRNRTPSRKKSFWRRLVTSGSRSEGRLSVKSNHLAAPRLKAGAFLRSTLRFAASPDTGRARKVLRASLLYLPGLLAALIADRIVHGIK